MTDVQMKDIRESKDNVFDENAASHKMDLQSRTAAALGVETMKNLSSLTVLVIGLTGVGVETAKNLILTGPKKVVLHDDNECKIADLGTNFYINESHVQQKLSRTAACTKTLAELNPYCTVDSHSGDMSDDFIQSFGVVVVTITLPMEQITHINDLCRARKDSDGKDCPSGFIIAVTHGVSAHFFTDFGTGHVITDIDGEPSRSLVVKKIERDLVLVAAKSHGFDDGDGILFEDIEGEETTAANTVSLSVLNGLANVHIKRHYYKYDFKRSDGKIEQRTRQHFNEFYIDASKTEYAGKMFSPWTNGGLINEVKAKYVYNFRSLRDTLQSPCFGDDNYGLSCFLGPQHPDQGAWEQGAGKTLHLLYFTALQFNEQTGHFPRLHNEDDSYAFLRLYRKINEDRKELDMDGVLVVDTIDTRRVKAYSWFFEAELTGYCAFLGGVAAQEVVKKFGKYKPVFQWLHSDHAQFISGQIPSDGYPLNCRYDHQIAIFGKSFQQKIANQKIFLVGVGALGCEYLKGLALMGVATGPKGKIWCTDMDRIEISNLSRQFLFRARHVGKPKSTTAAQTAIEMNPSLNIEALEMKVWPETEDYFTDEFWDNLDLCWNALDNVHARKYTDNKCLIHSKPLLESGTQGTKCNSDVIIPFKTRTYNDGEEQETEGIPMCTLQNFPYLPIHCIEWARSSFGKFEQDPKTYNTFYENVDKYFEQVQTAEGEERVSILKSVCNLVKLQLSASAGITFADCINLAFNEYVQWHITRIKDLIFCFPEDETIKDEYSGEPIGKFWIGNKRFPTAAKFDLNDEQVFDYVYSASNLWAYAFGIPYVRDTKEFLDNVRNAGLCVPKWIPNKNIKIKVDDGAKKDGDEDGKTDSKTDSKEDDSSGDCNEAEEKEIEEMIEFLKKVNRKKLHVLNVIEFEKDDDSNFHIAYITACTNTRARNYRIKETSRHQCKIIAGKIIAALATTTAMICGLVELEFYKLQLGMEYIHEDGFYNANINLGVAQFQYFQPDSAVRNERVEKVDESTNTKEVIVPYPNMFTSWDTLVVDDKAIVSIQQFVDAFPKLFWGVTVELLHKLGKMEKGKLLFSSMAVLRNTKMQDSMLARKNLSVKMRKRFEKELEGIQVYNDGVRGMVDAKVRPMVEYYVEIYGKLVSKDRKYILLAGSFTDVDGNIAKMPRIKFCFS